MCSTTYKVTPRSLESFKRNFNLQLEDHELIEQYKIYLVTNEETHHYLGKSKEEWLQEEVAKYTSNN